MARTDKRPAEHIIDLLIEHELLAAELYQVCKVRCPGHAAFWQQMADAECGHARILEKLAGDLRKQRATFNPRLFRKETVDAANATLSHVIAEVNSGSLGPKGIFARAIGFEKSLIEHAFYEIAEGDDPVLVAFKQVMKKSILNHQQKLEEEFNRLP